MMKQSSSNTEDDKKGTYVGAVLGGLLVVGGILATVLTLTGGEDPSVESADGGPQAQVEVDLCGEPAASHELPDEGFVGHPVELESGVRIAQLDGGGPCKIEPIPVGYAPSPEGALLAAANYATLISVQGDEMTEVIEALTVPGPDTDAMLAELKASPLPLAEQFQVQGFKIYELNTHEYRVTLAVKGPGVAQPVSWTLSMSWDGTDWKAAPADPITGWEVTSMQGVTIDGFTTWGF